MGLAGRCFEAGMFVEDIYYCGDTRSADDLAVFTRMVPERFLPGVWTARRGTFFPFDD